VDRKSFKELQKKKKEIYRTVEQELLPYKEIFSKTSPLHDVLVMGVPPSTLLAKTNPNIMESMLELYEKGERHLVSLYQDLHEKFLSNVHDLCLVDKSIELGVTDANERREGLVRNFLDLITFFNLEVQFETVSQLHFLPLGKVTHTRLLHQCYYESNELHGEYGTKLSRLCFENLEYATLLEMLKIEPNYRSWSLPPLIQYFGAEDRVSLCELVAQGDPFYVYRGFLIDEDEYVRKGKRIDGLDYFKQSAGMGVSYSLREDVAFYFCYWGLIFGTTPETDVLNQSSKSIQDPLESVPFPLWTEDEFIDYNSRILSRRIDELRKKPIVCKFLVDPTQIKGFNFIKGESELNLLPDDLVIDRYQIASSRDIAINLLSCKRRSVRNLEDFQGCYKEEGVVLWMTSLGGKKVYIYADASRVNTEIAVLKNELMQSGERYSHDMLNKIRDLFLDAAIEVPSDIDPAMPTSEWIKFIQSKSQDLRLKSGKWYPAE